MADGIRGIAKTYQAMAQVLNRLRDTNDACTLTQLERIGATYENKVGLSNWSAISSGASLGFSGALGIGAALLNSDGLKALATISSKTDDIAKSVLHGYEIHEDKDLKLEDHDLSQTKELERQAAELLREIGQGVSQAMQIEANMGLQK